MPGRFAFAFVFFAACLLPSCARPSYELELTKSLATSGGAVCQGYLAANTKEAQRVVLWMSGTGTMSNAELPDSLAALIESGEVAVVTFNKPGITASFGEPGSTQVDFDLLENYTQGDLLDCAGQALVWAEQQFGSQVQFLLRGHSEGALISVYLYQALQSERPNRAKRVPHLVLSGFPVEHLPDIVSRQVDALAEPDKTKLQEALELCNWSVLQNSLAVSCTYLEDAAVRPSGLEAFKQLAAAEVGADFYFVQGTEDAQTPASFTRELEMWNGEEGHLNMHFYYYEGGHMGSEEARAWVLDLLRELTL